jgi:hypothetical protein
MEHFTHLTQYQIIICKDCKYAVLPSQIDSHLASAKHRIPVRRRRAIQEKIQTWPELLQNEADLVRLQMPTHGPPPLEQLEVYVDGRKCGTCGHIMRTDEGIKKHYRIRHGWVNHWKKGLKATDRRRARLSVGRPWTEGVHCQRFFPQGRRQEYFEMQPSRPSTEAPEDALLKWEQARIQLTQKWAAVQDRERRIIQEGQSDEVNPWLERAEWPSYLTGLDWAQLMQSVNASDAETEPVYAAI